ncbi:TPA: hypothetical protein H1005_03985 [archaeon]|uniref:Uncharacterized protein n=1 Tax=Candidatus Naiadarchaeum limnaeum TaxID=2756139 RepID=A0A832XGE7_9ARCH|nr:hypothetical protein [Candidatus Naiadarchaeales archaeon SRR2090153.bin1042]HIK00099.1 hypothetical protein [Candidatus Naiadarchaeum limnaeum]
MRKIFPYVFIGIVTFIILLNAISAQAAVTYPYQYNYVSSSITFDEKGKAVLVATLNAETLRDEAVDEITLRIPYADVSIWYVKEQVEKRELLISLSKDCVYTVPYAEGAVDITARSPSYYPPPCSNGKIRSNVYYRSDYFDTNLDIKTEVRGGSTYVKIPLRGAFYSKEARKKIEELNIKEAEKKVPDLIEKFNNTNKDFDEIKQSSYEVAGKITIKYSVPGAIKVAEKEGKLEFKTITDVNAPIEVLTVGVSAPYGYKFEGKPDFPLATQTEIQRSGISAPLAGIASSGGGAYSISKGAVSGASAQKTSAAISELTQIASGEGFITEPYYPDSYPQPTPQQKIDYIEVRSNIDGNEIVNIEGKYQVVKEKSTELPSDLEKYLPYIIGIVVILGVAAIAQRYKLLWD